MSPDGDNEVDMKALGRLGGLKAAQNRREKVDAATHGGGWPLNTPEDLKKRLEIIQNLAITGKLTGSQAGAAVRAGEVWLRAFEAEQNRQRIKELEAKIAELERALSAQRGEKRRVG